MKLPHASATATALTILAAMIALPALHEPRPTIRTIPFACRSTRASRTSTSSAIIERWRSVPRRPQAARRNAWSIHITAGRMPGAASAKSGLSRIECPFDLNGLRRSAGRRAAIHQP